MRLCSDADPGGISHAASASPASNVTPARQAIRDTVMNDTPVKWFAFAVKSPRLRGA
jgi:hypothetical protein